jgi:hypothetical protein
MQALDATLQNYVSMLEVFKEERAQLLKDINSNERTASDLRSQRDIAWDSLRVSHHAVAWPTV